MSARSLAHTCVALQPASAQPETMAEKRPNEKSEDDGPATLVAGVCISEGRSLPSHLRQMRWQILLL